MEYQDIQGHVVEFGFDVRNGRAPLEGISMSQGLEFLGRQLSKR